MVSKPAAPAGVSYLQRSVCAQTSVPLTFTHSEHKKTRAQFNIKMMYLDSNDVRCFLWRLLMMRRPLEATAGVEIGCSRELSEDADSRNCPARTERGCAWLCVFFCFLIQHSLVEKDQRFNVSRDKLLPPYTLICDLFTTPASRSAPRVH